ncbi:hypothetical protein F4823DRAFT_375289 [Ustulina deusta]|nr:hypothetical protein F4823DRAFT_375289 [Ustulina deusta]
MLHTLAQIAALILVALSFPARSRMSYLVHCATVASHVPKTLICEVLGALSWQPAGATGLDTSIRYCLKLGALCECTAVTYLAPRVHLYCTLVYCGGLYGGRPPLSSLPGFNHKTNNKYDPGEAATLFSLFLLFPLPSTQTQRVITIVLSRRQSKLN